MPITLTKIADNWDTLPTEQKQAAFDKVSVDAPMPSIEELRKISPFRIVRYCDNVDFLLGTTLTAIPKTQLVMPEGLLSITNYENINRVTIANTISGKGNCKMAVTVDNKTFQIYDKLKRQWEPITSMTADNLLAKGMSITDIEGLTKTEWGVITNNCKADGLGFAYALDITDSTDACKIDTLTMNVDMRGTWQGATLNTDYSYTYNNTLLTVTILQDGSYKINYPQCLEETPKIEKESR